MDKNEFIKELSKELNCDLEYARKVSDLLEENFLIGKKNKEKTINLFKQELKVSDEDANRIYNICSSIINNEIKNKLKHPFRDLDK